MIVEKKKFPFKLMPKIITALENKDLPTSLQIARSIRSCLPDADEVIQMLQYITNFGKIKSNSEGNWIIIKKESSSEPPSKNFRYKYIKNLMSIIDVLDDQPRNTGELAKKVSQDSNETEEALTFLSSITEKGFIDSQGSGNDKKWYLNPWISKSLNIK